MVLVIGCSLGYRLWSWSLGGVLDFGLGLGSLLLSWYCLVVLVLGCGLCTWLRSFGLGTWLWSGYLVVV